MRSATPKPLHVVAGRPIIDHILAALAAAGLPRPIAVVAPGADAVAGRLAGRADLAVQAARRGTGDALAAARTAVADSTRRLLVIPGDAPLLTASTLRRLMDAHSAAMTMLIAAAAPQPGLGRIVRDAAGRVSAVVEERDASPTERALTEVNLGVYALEVDGLWDALAALPRAANGEVYLTALAARLHKRGKGVDAVAVDDPHEGIGVNTRADLALAEAAMQARIRRWWMDAGVTLVDPATTYIDAAAAIGADSVVRPNTHLLGATRVGAGCVIGPNAILTDTVVGDRCIVIASALEGAVVEDGADVGPFAHLRRGAHIGAGAHIGNYVEVKESSLGRGVKAGHFSYIGDASVGDGVNIGAGVITANYDGAAKHTTEVADGAFVGADTVLVAPVRVGAEARTGAGAVVTRDVPDGETVAGVPARPMRGKRAAGGNGKAPSERKHA